MLKFPICEDKSTKVYYTNLISKIFGLYRWRWNDNFFSLFSVSFWWLSHITKSWQPKLSKILKLIMKISWKTIKNKLDENGIGVADLFWWPCVLCCIVEIMILSNINFTQYFLDTQNNSKNGKSFLAQTYLFACQITHWIIWKWFWTPRNNLSI